MDNVIFDEFKKYNFMKFQLFRKMLMHTCKKTWQWMVYNVTMMSLPYMVFDILFLALYIFNLCTLYYHKKTSEVVNHTR